MRLPDLKIQDKSFQFNLISLIIHYQLFEWHCVRTIENNKMQSGAVGDGDGSIGSNYQHKTNKQM